MKRASRSRKFPISAELGIIAAAIIFVLAFSIAPTGMFFGTAFTGNIVGPSIFYSSGDYTLEISRYFPQSVTTEDDFSLTVTMIESTPKTYSSGITGPKLTFPYVSPTGLFNVLPKVLRLPENIAIFLLPNQIRLSDDFVTTDGLQLDLQDENTEWETPNFVINRPVLFKIKSIIETLDETLSISPDAKAVWHTGEIANPKGIVDYSAPDYYCNENPGDPSVPLNCLLSASADDIGVTPCACDISEDTYDVYAIYPDGKMESSARQRAQNIYATTNACGNEDGSCTAYVYVVQRGKKSPLFSIDFNLVPLYGDVNSDGTQTQEDLSLLNSLMAISVDGELDEDEWLTAGQNLQSFQAANLHCDEIINILDSVALNSLLQGTISESDVGCYRVSSVDVPPNEFSGFQIINVGEDKQSSDLTGLPRALPALLTFVTTADLDSTTTTGLTSGESYNFVLYEVLANNSATENYELVEITLSADTTYGALISAMNTEMTIATASIIDGDLIFTSNLPGATKIKVAQVINIANPPLLPPLVGQGIDDLVGTGNIVLDLFSELTTTFTKTETAGLGTDHEFTFIVTVDGTSMPVKYVGDDARTFSALTTEISSDLNGKALAFMSNGNIVIESATEGPDSSISITAQEPGTFLWHDGTQIINGYVELVPAVQGRSTETEQEQTFEVPSEE